MASQTAHTPGPWSFGGKSQEGQTVVYAVNPHHRGEEWVADCNTGHHSAKECVANARLIAAAPEMLATVENLARVLVQATDARHMPDCNIYHSFTATVCDCPYRHIWAGATVALEKARALLRAVEG